MNLKIEVMGKIRGGALTRIEGGAHASVSKELGRLSIGSAPGNAPSLVLEDPTVSRNHAEVVLEQGKWWIRDLNSDNGMHLISDGRRVREWAIEDGGLLGVGEVVLSFTLK